MRTTRTERLTLKFEVDGEGEDLDVLLTSIEPKGTGLEPGAECPFCVFRDAPEEELEEGGFYALTPPVGIGGRLCDACAVQESISQLGADAFIESYVDIKIELPGELEVVGYMTWQSWSGPDGYDCDEEFDTEEFRWTPGAALAAVEG